MRAATRVQAALAVVAAGLAAGGASASAATRAGQRDRLDVLRAQKLRHARHVGAYPLGPRPRALAQTAAKKHRKHKRHKPSRLVRSGTVCPERTSSRVTGMVATLSVRQVSRARARVAVTLTATASRALTLQVGRSVFHDPFHTSTNLALLQPFADYFWHVQNVALQPGRHTYRLPAQTITALEPEWLSTTNIHRIGSTRLVARPVSGAAVEVLDPAPRDADQSVTAAGFGSIILPDAGALMLGTAGRTGVKSLVYVPNAFQDAATVAATPEGAGQVFTAVNRGALDVIRFGSAFVPLPQAGAQDTKLPAGISCTGSPVAFPANAPNLTPPPIG